MNPINKTNSRLERKCVSNLFESSRKLLNMKIHQLLLGIPLLLLCQCARHLSPEVRNVEYSYAKSSAPYAAMCALVYDDQISAVKPEDACRLKTCQAFLTNNGWRRLHDVHQSSKADATGLQYAAWLNDTYSPKVLCVAFRGTEFTKPRDWQANFHGLTQFMSFVPKMGKNQYQLLPEEMQSTVIDRYQKEVDSGRMVIVTTGHSLGGGLSQCFQYNFPNHVRQCYAFDPSPVTGYGNTSRELRHKFKSRLGAPGFPDADTLRIHQRGEVLEYVRSPLHFTAPYSNQVDKLRFDVKDKNRLFDSPANLHNMSLLAAGIISRTSVVDARGSAPCSGSSEQVPSSYHQPWWMGK